MSQPATASGIIRTDNPASPLVARTYGEPRFHCEGDVAAIAFATDNTLWSVDEAGVLNQWSVEGKQLKRFYLSDLETLWCFAPDARLLVSANDDLLFWDVREGQLIKRIEFSAWTTALAFSHDGQTLASGHDDGQVCFWASATQSKTGRIVAHSKPVSALAFDPTGRFLATAGEDRIVRVWDVDSHKQRAELVSHTDRIPSLAWSGDGELLVSAGWDTSARVWKIDDADPQMLLNSHADQVFTLAFSPKGETLATADSDHTIHIWTDPIGGRSRHVLHGHVDEIRCLTFDATGERLASAGSDRVVHIWDVETGTLLAGPNPQGRHGIAIIESKTHPLIASTGSPSFRLWDQATGSEQLPQFDGPAQSVAASADGRWLAIGGNDHFTRLYDLRSPKSDPKLLEATKPPIGNVAFAPDGSMLTHTSPKDGLVWIWNTETAEPKLILIEAADGCTLEALAFHPDGSHVAVGGIDYLSTCDRDGAVCVWDLQTEKKSATFDNGVTALAFDSTGRYLAGAGINDRIYVWDLTTDELVFELEGHQQRINDITFAHDGSYLISAGDDMTVRVWDVLTGRLLVVRGFEVAILSVTLSNDGRMVYTGNANTTCYAIPFEKLLEE